MSWLNLNDSLNTLKGQLSNFANNVLAEEDQSKDENSPDLGNLQRICGKQQEEINYLRKINAELRQGNDTSMFSKDDRDKTNENWSWEVSDAPQSETSKTDKIIADLRKTISDLENEKHELVSSLELLDSEHQVNTEKLITLKDKLQEDYNDLEDKYVTLKNNNERLLENEKHIKCELDGLKSKYNELVKKGIQSTEVNNDVSCNKCENLVKENQKYLSELETLKNEIDKEKLEEKLKLCESENRILVTEMKKATQSIAEFEKKSEIDKDNCKKLAFILEGYEQQVSSLKEELMAKNTFWEELQKAKEEKEQMHTKYVNILTENMKKYADGELSGGLSNNDADPQLSEFSHQVESILNILLDLKNKCGNLEKELYNVTEEKTNILSEKNHEIEKLLQNSEILSQEVITKSQTIKDYENECSELIKNNDMLINELEMFKNSSGLQTISESNEDNVLMLESQLENANKKIEELEKIIFEMENKDPLEEKLEKLKIDLENTEYQNTEMNINLESLKEEVENYKRKNEQLIEQKVSLEKLNLEYERSTEDIRSELNVIREKLLLEEDTRKQLESQVRGLTEKLQNAKMSETSLKLQYDTISKELIALTDAKQIAEANLQNCLTNFNRIREENERLKASTNTEEVKNLVNTLDQLKLEYSSLEKKLEELTASKNELTNVILTKHQENVTYHNEIQRLSQILNTEMEKNRILEAQLEATPSQNDEIEKLTDQNNFLKQKCEVLAENLLQEQSKVQQILAEQNTKKLERLQSHLIEIEEHYTQELLRAEEKNAELQAKVNEVEQREKNSSTMYTSVSIRANQHVETLQNQLQLITNQRDELRRKMSDAEDHARKQEAALANLQFVLEQFQKEKENAIQKETERIRRQITAEKRVQDDLRKEISNLQSQLEESKQGLLAASRISDQLEQSKHLTTTLKNEVTQLKEKLHKSEEHLKNLSSQTDGKVDKSLIKNLVIGFVSTNSNLTKDQTQILKIIATVLDFNQQDHDKLNLNKPQQGWLTSLLSPQTSQGMSQESLSQAFVKFLENESKPRSVPSLLSNNGETPKSRKNSVTAPRQSPSVLSEVVLPTFADFAQNRNSSSILKDVLKDNS